MFSRTSRRLGGRRKSLRTRCSTTPVSQHSPARLLAILAKAICGSVSPIPSRTSRKHLVALAIGQRKICRATASVAPQAERLPCNLLISFARPPRAPPLGVVPVLLPRRVFDRRTVVQLRKT